jgi:Holliday junction DNA helicase RuvB
LARIIRRSAGLLDFPFESDATEVLATRSRGTPRVANRLLRRVRDFAEVKADGRLTATTVQGALDLEGIDPVGLDELDRRFLRTILEVYKGGPVGIEAVAATLHEETDTLTDLVEPYLLKCEFLVRTPQGRRITDAGRRHLGSAPDVERPSQGDLALNPRYLE